MNSFLFQYKLFVKRMLLLFAIYSLLRLLFFISNHSYFSTLTAGEFFLALLAGLRFDLVAIVISNILFIALSLLPFRFFFTKWYQVILAVLYFVINSIAILINAVDCAYYKFILKRSTADLLSLIALGNDTANNLGSMAATFWYVPAILIGCMVLMIYAYRKLKVEFAYTSETITMKNWMLRITLFLLAGGVVVIAFRGGLQYKPLGILAAAQYTSPQNAPLVLNSAFTFIKTAYKDELPVFNYFSDSECEKYFNAEKNYTSSQPFRQLNVCVIILESIGKEYIGFYNKGKGYTPFLDSLAAQSLTFQYSFANSKKSIEGIPAVTASIPALMSAPFITSVYNGNNINSIASLLKLKGYSSAFFHGGNNGTMGFDNFTRMAGYDYYYGRNEYEIKIGKNDYDGYWGIFDEKFYSYFVDEMSEMQQPFVSTVFTISSHHPYIIPAEYKNRFPKGTLEVHESVGYSDFALQSFFEKAKSQSWYNNTLFVITSDHTSQAEGEFYQNKMGIYTVPVIYFMADGSLKGFSKTITQQCDILPSVLDYMNYDLPFVAFGQSIFDSTAGKFSAQFMDDSYQIFSGDYLIQFDGDSILSAYNFKKDSLLKNKISVQSADFTQQLNQLKAYMQQFNNRMIKNKMSTYNKAD